ncbi:probable pleckstrin homology domain-containing family N member 1 [Myxocyprinus asiaticus]|uniref:probable pleckstrin homology domain-containing family N member 1 n=1 Tax=Myxocyprinus asiaticus TaxID=70543 RepID=UPI0022212FC3|nr:probable pleckstrin homology domain-containing family N member 1 [Myxocyprinus asiaticus]
MGSSMSCVPQHNFRFSSKSFIRRNSSRLFRKKYPQEGQEKSNSIINILCTVTPRKEMSPKDLQTIENIKWDPPFPYDPVSGWKKSSINVKNYGRMIHSSKVRFRFLHCQDVHDCYLDLFQTHLHFVSNNTTGLTYQGTLPLKELTICKVKNRNSFDVLQEFAFQINGVSLNPIIVYCLTEEEMNNWFGLLKEQIEANGGSAFTQETYTRIKVQCLEETTVGKEELRNSISKELIYEWEGSQRESLGPITYVTKVRLQHMPCQEMYDRLLVMYPNYLIILSEESDGLFYKGKLPLNMITVTTPCQDIKPNTFMIEGKLINPIIVSCLNKSEFHEWIQYFKNADVPILSPPPPVYDIIYTPTQKQAPETDRWSGSSHGGADPLRQSQDKRRSHELQLPSGDDNTISPGYTEPLNFISSRPTSSDTQYSAHLGSRSSSFSSHARPTPAHRPVSLHYSSPPQSSYLSSEGPMSPVYNTPYSSAHCNGPVQHTEKAPLVKSKSWSTSQSSVKHQLLVPHRHSDLVTHRKPLSPLYDDPSTPTMYPLEENSAHASHSSRGSMEQSYPPHLPPTFRLCTPPLGRKNRHNQAMETEVASSQWSDELRAKAVSRLKILPAPNRQTEHNYISQRGFSGHTVTEMPQMSYSYSPDDNSYLQPVEPDDQEMDYDNIWEYDQDNSMIQPLPGTSPHRTLAHYGAQGLGAMTTQQRWS